MKKKKAAKKKAVKKPEKTVASRAKKKSVAQTKKARKREVPVGTVTHFYGGIKVAVIKFKKSVRGGTKVRVKGATTDFIQKFVSMQYNHKAVTIAPKGKQTGVKVSKRVRQGDTVYLLS